MSNPNRKTICQRLPSHDVDEADVGDHGKRKGEFADRFDIIGEKEVLAIEHYVIDQHRPRLAEVEGSNPELGEAIDLALPQCESAWSKDPVRFFPNALWDKRI